MDRNLIATSTVEIDATIEQVWDAMTNPEKIKVYLHGTETTTDWREGSPIEFKGEYEGQTYHDKGEIREVVLHRRIVYTYLSSFSGLADEPGNYALVSYLIDPLEQGGVRFTWHQQGFTSAESQGHTEEGLAAMLQQIKKLVEAG